MVKLLGNSARIVLGLAVVVALSLASPAPGAEGKGKITGKVLDKDGKGVAGTNVMLRTPPEKGGKKRQVPAAAAPKDDKGERQKPIAKARTEADGSFTLADVPAGEYMLMARTRDGHAAREKVAVKADETTTVELKLKEGKQGDGGKKKDRKKKDAK